MATNSTPSWSAARSGLLGDTGAVDASAQVNQLLGTHPGNTVYQGNSILTPNGSGGTAWAYHLDAYDIDQPFTMSGTSVGRVTVPLLPVGAGADLTVSLCTDSGGNPNTVIAQTRIPASWINQLSAVAGVAGPSSQPPLTQLTDNPLATAAFNSFHMGATTLTNWPYPTTFPGGTVVSGAQAYYGGYYFVVGAENGSTFYNNVYTIQYDAAGNLAPALPQPGLPAPSGGSNALGMSADPATGDLTFVVAGGSTAPGTVASSVYTASFNQATGVLSSWSTQASLPQALRDATFAAWNGYVYVLGGTNSGNTANLNTVYWAQIQNGQITGWQSGTYPLALDSVYMTALDGFLVVFGGETFAGAAQTACYYTPIRADGSLGTWQAGPTLPATNVAFQVGTPTFGSYGVMAIGNSQAYMLGVTANGPDTSWQTFTQPQGGDQLAEAVGEQAGTWQHYGLYSTYYATFPVTLTPRISVPLPATGLSNGATYHVLLQQAGGTLNDYLRTHDDFDVFPGNPTLLTRAAGSTTWTAGTTGHAVPIQVYDNSNGTGAPGAANNSVVHTWEDNGARTATFVNYSTPDRRLLGVLESTAQPGPVLNSNPTFTTGTAPWAGNNGALAQSNAFTHGALPFSAKLTPNGVSTQAYIESELLAVTLQQPHVANAWVYSPSGYSNVDIQINWYTSAGFSGFISSTVGATTSVAAGTWTQLAVSATQAPATAVYGTVAVYEKGTPPSSALLYASAVTMQNGIGPRLASVAQITYPGTWPGTGLWPPTGVTALA